MMGATILVVDDEDAVRQLLVAQVESLGFTARTAVTGLSALSLMRQEPVDVVLLDVMMPGLSGYEVLDKMKRDESLRYVPVLMITGVNEEESAARCIGHGAEDYLTKPFSRAVLEARIKKCVAQKHWHDEEEEYRHRLEEYSTELEDRVRQQLRELSSTHLATIFAMSKLAESRDPETGEHLERVREFARILSEYVQGSQGFAELSDEAFRENLYNVMPLHDIGKVGIPDEILQKVGKLTAEEFDVMKRHSKIGADALRAVSQQHPGNVFVEVGIQIAEGHHERWDGSGYPRGLAGRKIPVAARIAAIADVYDALTSKRCYKEAFSHERSVTVILEGRGANFEPALVDAFEARNGEFADVKKRFPDSSKAPAA